MYVVVKTEEIICNPLLRAKNEKDLFSRASTADCCTSKCSSAFLCRQVIWTNDGDDDDDDDDGGDH